MRCDIRRQFAAANDIFTCWVHVHAMWRFRGRQEIHQSGTLGRDKNLDCILLFGSCHVRRLVIPVNDIGSWKLFELSGSNKFFCLLPIDGGDEVFVVLGCVDLQQGILLFGIIGSKEGSSMRIPFSGMRQVIIKGGHQDLESNIHVAGSWIDFDK